MAFALLTCCMVLFIQLLSDGFNNIIQKEVVNIDFAKAFDLANQSIVLLWSM